MPGHLAARFVSRIKALRTIWPVRLRLEFGESQGRNPGSVCPASVTPRVSNGVLGGDRKRGQALVEQVLPGAVPSTRHQGADGGDEAGAHDRIRGAAD